MSTNRVVDPTWFYDALLEFSFDYDWYVKTGIDVDQMGRRISRYDKRTITGSLQPKRASIEFSKEGNTNKHTYEFYCKSLFRIDVGDFIFYKNQWLYVDEMQPYDEYGVRECTLTMVNLTNYKDFQEYLDYLNGDISV